MVDVVSRPLHFEQKHINILVTELSMSHEVIPWSCKPSHSREGWYGLFRDVSDGVAHPLHLEPEKTPIFS